MEDSPLSITASVAGILTFVAAIVAFIYVRYAILRDSGKEMSSILESVLATVSETRALEEILTQHPEPTELKDLVQQLYSVELYILAEYMRAYKLYGDDIGALQSVLHPKQDRTWADVALEFQRAVDYQSQKYNSPVGRLSKFAQLNSQYLKVLDTFIQFDPSPYSSSFWGGLNLVLGFSLTLGQTPKLLRWYVIRDGVLEKIKHREILRSRVLFQQVSTVNRQLTSQDTILQQLRRDNSEILSELARLIGEVTEVVTKLMTDNAKTKEGN